MADTHGVPAIAAPLLFAIIFNWGLLGILTVQIYLYYLAFPDDRWVLKATVWIIFALETLQTILLTKSEFRSLAVQFSDPKGLDSVDIIWFSVPMLCGIVASISQLFYAYRLWIMTRSKFLVGLIMLLSAAQLGGALALGVRNKNAVVFSRLFNNSSKGSYIAASFWEGSSAACDVLIAIFMTYHLRKKNSVVKQTQVLLTRIIRLTIQTGSFTAVVALSVLVLVYLPGHPTYYQACVAVLGKAYSNSMMVALNSRVQVTSSSASPQWNEQSLANEHKRGPSVRVFITRSFNSDVIERPQIVGAINSTLGNTGAEVDTVVFA